MTDTVPTDGDARMEPAWAGRRLVKTERLARELMQRRESIPPPLLAALLIGPLEEAERRNRRMRGLAPWEPEEET